MAFQNERHNKTNTYDLIQVQKKINTLISGNSFFAKVLPKARQEKALEKFNKWERGKKKKSCNEKLEKLKIDDLRVDVQLFKKFLKMKKYGKRPRYAMDPILDGEIYGLMSKYDLEQFKGAQNIFNGFTQNNGDIDSELQSESYIDQLSKTLNFFFDKFLMQVDS